VQLTFEKLCYNSTCKLKQVTEIVLDIVYHRIFKAFVIRKDKADKPSHLSLRCSGRVSNSCSTSDICLVTLVTNHMISHKRSIEKQSISIIRNGYTSYGGISKTLEVMTWTSPLIILGWVASLLDIYWEIYTTNICIICILLNLNGMFIFVMFGGYVL